MKVTLTVTAGPHEGQEFVFEEHETFLVGRATHAHFSLPRKDLFFSRTHFMIEVNPPRCRITDMESRNGTLVNGEPIASEDLHDGDVIQGGYTALTVRIDGAAPVQDTHHAVRKTADDPSTPPESQPTEQAEPDTQTQEFLSGQKLFAGYRLARELGRGGMGVVYLAESHDHNLPVAIKMMNPGQAIPQRDIDLFLREGRVLSKLDHPGILRYFESGEFDGRFYIATEYVPGRNVGSLLDEQGPLPIRRAVGIICQLLDALDYAHRQGFVHRDIKPGNLMLKNIGDFDIIKLTDFGLAKVYQSMRSSGLTFEGEMGGSFAFAAPEQITDFRSAKPASDLYSVAATLYTLLTNQHVYDFPKTVSGIVLKLLHEDPVPILTRGVNLPAAIAPLIHRGLARDPKQRYGSAREMRKSLLHFV